MIGTKHQRQVAVTFLAAGILAVIGEHYLKPTMRRKLRG